MSEEDCHKELLKKVSEQELEEWLNKNPPPSNLWGKYAWAYLEMPPSRVMGWLRNVGVKI